MFPVLVAGMRNRSVVKIDPEIMSGTPCFRGTRVPVRTLFDCIKAGETLDEFLEGFPSVSRKKPSRILMRPASGCWVSRK
jgi:uncharacterized protein (DUF433 family)